MKERRTFLFFFSSHFLPLSSSLFPRVDSPPPSPLFRSLSRDTMRAAALAPSPRSAAAFSSAAAPLRRASAVTPLAAKPTKAADFRGLSNDEIDKAVAESKRALFDMRIAQKTRQVRRKRMVLARVSLSGDRTERKRALQARFGRRHPAPSPSSLSSSSNDVDG